jgi:hypothetical protein
MGGESALELRPARGAPRVLITDHQGTKGYRLSISAIRASPFSRACSMNGLYGCLTAEPMMKPVLSSKDAGGRRAHVVVVGLL